MLEEEKRVIHALRRGVELQDYGSVKGLLALAEKMNLTGEEVKQAQAMRLRIEVSYWRRWRVFFVDFLLYVCTCFVWVGLGWRQFTKSAIACS